MKVICVSGKSRHGKDTASKLLKELIETDNSNGKKVLIVSYAGLLKYICNTFFGWNGKKNAYGRSLLQRVGTEVIRAKDPDYWVRFISDQMGFFEDEWSAVIISDARFPNEVEFLRESGHDVSLIRIIRNNFDNGLTEDQKNHPSETALDDYPVDATFNNDGSIDDLRHSLSQWLKEVWYIS